LPVEFCSPQDENAQACYVIEGAMTLYFTSDDENLIMDAKKEILKSILISMAGGEFLSDGMPSLLRVRYLRPNLTQKLGIPIDAKNVENEDSPTINTLGIAVGSTVFVAVCAYLVRGRVLSRGPAESNASLHDESIHSESIHDESINVESEAV